MSFDGFTTADFEAYLPKKWRSNVFTLERLQVKQKLQELAKVVGPSLLARDQSPLEFDLSAEHPAVWNQRQVTAQHLYFSRNEGSRAEIAGLIARKRSMASLVEDPSRMHNHVQLFVSLNHEHLSVGLRLHAGAAVDRENLQRRAEDFFQKERLVSAYQQLDPRFRSGMEDPPQVKPEDVDDATLGGWMTQLDDDATCLRTRRDLPIEQVVERGAAIADDIRDDLVALLPLFHEVAWSRDNDFMSVKESIKEETSRKRTKGLETNDRIRVIQGLFSGKAGVVQEVDPKGGLKVLLGKMSVKLDSADVVKL